MTDNNLLDMPTLPPISEEEINKLLNELKTSQGQFAKNPLPIIVAGDHKVAMAALLPASLAEPWVRDAKAHGSAVQAAVDRYQKVYNGMGRSTTSYTCIDKRQAAMTAAIELYCSLVAELLCIAGDETSKKPPSSAAEASKGLRVAAEYHRHQAQTYLEEEARLLRIYESHGDKECREMATDASDKAKTHLDAAGDMLRMALGNKPEWLDDAFGAFERAKAKILA